MTNGRPPEPTDVGEVLNLSAARVPSMPMSATGIGVDAFVETRVAEATTCTKSGRVVYGGNPYRPSGTGVFAPGLTSGSANSAILAPLRPLHR